VTRLTINLEVGEHAPFAMWNSPPPVVPARSDKNASVLSAEGREDGRSPVPHGLDPQQQPRRSAVKRNEGA